MPRRRLWVAITTLDRWRRVLIIIIITSLFNAWHTAGWCTTASHRYERCWSGASRLPTARSSLQAAYSQHRPCGALVPAEAGPNFAAWWAGVHVCEQLTQVCYAVCLGRGSNSRPSDRESRTLTIEPPRHTNIHYNTSVLWEPILQLKGMFYSPQFITSVISTLQSLKF